MGRVREASNSSRTDAKPSIECVFKGGECLSLRIRGEGRQVKLLEVAEIKCAETRFTPPDPPSLQMRERLSAERSRGLERDLDERRGLRGRYVEGDGEPP